MSKYHIDVAVSATIEVEADSLEEAKEQASNIVWLDSGDAWIGEVVLKKCDCKDCKRKSLILGLAGVK